MYREVHKLCMHTETIAIVIFNHIYMAGLKGQKAKYDHSHQRDKLEAPVRKLG